MKQPDWSTAPEWATHYLPQKDGFAGRFYNLDTTPLRVDFCEGAGWEVSGNDPEGAWLEDLVARPTTQQWNGEGLPPVGTVCLHEDNMVERETRVEVTILAHTKRLGMDVAVFQYGDTISHSTARFFYPIRTPEQIAAEKRDAGIEALFTAGNERDMPAAYSDWAWMYDRGCRMTAEDER